MEEDHNQNDEISHGDQIKNMCLKHDQLDQRSEFEDVSTTKSRLIEIIFLYLVWVMNQEMSKIISMVRRQHIKRRIWRKE